MSNCVKAPLVVAKTAVTKSYYSVIYEFPDCSRYLWLNLLTVYAPHLNITYQKLSHPSGQRLVHLEPASRNL